MSQLPPRPRIRLGAHPETGGVRFAAFTDADSCQVAMTTDSFDWPAFALGTAGAPTGGAHGGDDG